MIKLRSTSDEDVGEVGTADTRYSDEAERKLSDEILEQYRRENTVEEVF